MFYENRKIIYTVLIILALSGAFFIGKKVGENTNMSASKSTSQNKVEENLNYNDNLQIQGSNYSISYVIRNGILLDKSTLNFNLSIQNNINVNNLKVIAKNQYNQDLNVVPNLSNNKNSLNYTIKFDSEQDKIISITVYPMTKDMAANSNLNFNTLPSKVTKLDIGLIKKYQIQSLEN